MICEKCKIRDANIIYTEVVNGVKSEHNLCSTCAREMDLGPYSAIFEGEFPLGKLLSSLFGIGSAGSDEESKSSIACPTCGTTYAEFVKNSRFGCSDCYHVFDLLIGEKIKNLQSSDSHKGKVPKMAALRQKPDVTKQGEVKLSAEQQVGELKRRLKAAITVENYEEAARLRDEIHRLEDN